MNSVAQALLGVHDALETGGIPHAIGGAIALAYCISEPRATRDIDVNIFAKPTRAAEALRALPPQVAHTRVHVERAQRDGQVRLWWEKDIPIDLFFDVHEFHAETAAGVRQVPFLDRTIPVIGCSALVVFKCLYGRTRDWADIEAVLEVGAIDSETTVARVAELLGGDHPSTVRLKELCEDRR